MYEFRRIGEWFVHQKLLTPAQLECALNVQRESRKRLGEVLIDCGFVSEEDVTTFLSYQYKMRVADLQTVRPKPAALKVVTAAFALSHLVLPIAVDETSFECVIDDPVDVPFLDDLQRIAGRRLVLSLAPRTSLFESIAKAYHVKRVPRLVPNANRASSRTQRRIAIDPQYDRALLLQLLSEVA
jgi:type IV pilus assembly protein PilB